MNGSEGTERKLPFQGTSVSIKSKEDFETRTEVFEPLLAGLKSTLFPSKSPPNVLYHYTSSSALINMIEINKIWATHIRYMNDEMEMKHCLEIFKKVGKEFLETTEHENERIIWHEYSLDNFFQKESKEFFVFSFSEIPDLLSQWTAYTKIPNGICLGLDCNKFTSSTLFPVIYDDNITEIAVRKAFMLIRETFREHNYFVRHPRRDRAILDCISIKKNILEDLAAFTKRVEWKDEKEWRAIVVRRQSPTYRFKYRVRGGIVIPYIEEKIWEGEAIPIKEIITSPGANYNLAMEGIIKLGEWKLENQWSIRPSSIPYRPQ